MRTLLVVFSIAVGVFSIGVISGAYEIISNDMSVSYAANNPSQILNCEPEILMRMYLPRFKR